MERTHQGIRAASIALGTALLAILLSTLACSRSEKPVTAPAPIAPTADSPENAVRLLAWCWVHRSIADYRPLLADDYRFVPAPYDSFPDPVLARDLTRDLELTAAENLFTRGTSQLRPVSRIDLDFDANLVALPDSRPEKDAASHREIRTSFALQGDGPDGGFRIRGGVDIFVVRGDSITVSGQPGLADRWYIERVDEEPGFVPIIADPARARATPDRTQPSRNVTWWALKQMYLR